MRILTINIKTLLFFCCMPAFVFSQIDSFFNQPYLKDMQAVMAILDSNHITTADPEEIIKIDSGRIVGLYLRSDNAEKPWIQNLPGNIGKLTALRELSLSRNSLKRLPLEIGFLTELRVLKLGENKLNTLPGTMRNLQKLEVLDLRYNDLDSLPQVVLSMKHLRKLQLWGNKLASLPDNVCDLDSLRELYLERNSLRTLPGCIVRLHTLVYMDFNFNHLCNAAPALNKWLEKWESHYREAQYCR